MEQDKTKIEYIIEPQRVISLNIRELWSYRELFYFFCWRDIKVKYKQTTIGVLWVFIQPLATMIIFSLFFGAGLNVPSYNIPYPVFVFSGIILWNVFSAGATGASNSMISNSQIIKKIYFPRLIIPISSVLVALFDFLIALLLLIAVLLFFNSSVDIVWAIIFWPLSILLAVVGTLGLSCWLAALNVKYRDVRYILPFLIQILLFVTPVIYPVSIVKIQWLKYVFSLNPMYGAITLFRLPILQGYVDWELIVISVFSSLFLIFSGILYFRKTEAFFADFA